MRVVARAHEARVGAVERREALADDDHRGRDADEQQDVGPHRGLRGLDQPRDEVEPAHRDAEPEQDRADRHEDDEHRGEGSCGRCPSAVSIPDFRVRKRCSTRPEPAAAMRAGDRRGDVGLEDVAARAGVHGAVVGAAGLAHAALVGQVGRRGSGWRARGHAVGARGRTPPGRERGSDSHGWNGLACGSIPYRRINAPKVSPLLSESVLGKVETEAATGADGSSRRVLNRLWAAHGPLPQAPYPPRRRPDGRRPARERARLHELQRLQSRSSPQPAAGQRRRRALLPAHGQGRGRLGPASAATRRSSACATATARASVPVRYTGAVPDPFRDGREVIVTVRKQGGDRSSARGHAGHKCPSKFTTSRRSRPERHGHRRPRLPDPRARRRASTAIGASLYGGAHRAGASGSTPARRAVYALAAADDRRVRGARGRLPALGLPLRRRRHALLDHDADLLQGRRGVVLAGGLAAAVGLAAVAVVEPRAVPHAPAHARRRALRDRRAARLRRLLRGLLVFAVTPFDDRGASRPPRARGSTRCCATRA